jgi:hypothetical protein
MMLMEATVVESPSTGAKEAKKDEEKKDHRDLLAEDHPDSMVKI